ncbi:hypothetical protein PENTCL1PPCAC_22387, partial [Pristionchus entomophagus]
MKGGESGSKDGGEGKKERRSLRQRFDISGEDAAIKRELEQALRLSLEVAAREEERRKEDDSEEEEEKGEERKKTPIKRKASPKGKKNPVAPAKKAKQEPVKKEEKKVEVKKEEKKEEAKEDKKEEKKEE